MSLEDNILGFLSSRDTQSTFVKGVALNDNKWHHVATVREAGKRLYWYVDGAEVGNQNITDTGTYQITSPVVFGAHVNHATQFFTGHIDEIRVFNRALNAQDVSRMYAEGIPRYIVSR